MKPASQSTVETIAELYPATFTAEPWRTHKPLKIGIHRDLIAQGVLAAKECRFLRYYTHRRMYLASLVEGSPRVDLAGAVAGQVTAEEATVAAKFLASIDAARLMSAHQVKQLHQHKASKAAPERPRPTPPKAPPTPKRLSLSDLKEAFRARQATP